jgi:capsid protein
VDIRRGVELDRFDAPSAYHVRYRSRNDVADVENQPVVQHQRIKRYTGSMLNVIHLFENERGGTQTRGISRIASVIKHVKMGERMTEAELEAMILSATYTYYIKSGLGDASAFEALGGVQSPAHAMIEAQADFHKAAPILLDGVKIPHRRRRAWRCEERTRPIGSRRVHEVRDQ